MSVVKINAITVPAERADELVGRFANRAGEVSKMPGFEAFELLRPTDDRDVFLVYTRWRSQEDFEHWLNGQKLLEYELGGPDWEARVKASKFVVWPHYGRATRGHIGIQGDHAGTLAIRHIRIRALD